MLVQLNKCVVCGSDLQRGNSGDGCVSLSILFKYESTRQAVQRSYFFGLVVYPLP